MNASHHPGSRRQPFPGDDCPSVSESGRFCQRPCVAGLAFPERQSLAASVGSIPGDDEDPLTPMAGANLTGGDAHGHARIPE